MPIDETGVQWCGPRHYFEAKQIGCTIVCAVCGAVEGTGAAQHKYGGTVHILPPSAHEDYVRNRIARGMHYDPADDGPEVGVIKALRPLPSNVGEGMRQVADVYLTVGAGYLLLANYQ